MSTAIGRPLALARPSARVLEGAAAGVVFVAAAVLRFVSLSRMPLDPFYDASVRSMGTSWHAFLVGAFEPSAGLAIDKPPLDLWLQVATTRLFGFGPAALLAPAALGGTLAVIGLYELLRTLFGARVALAGALALAVLPVAVITSRSDTMDSVMAALVVAAFAVAARGLRSGRVANMAVAGVLVGLAFEVKLFEALIAAVPLALLWWLGARRGRVAGSLVAIVCAVVVGCAWLVALTLFVPAAQRPWAFGSSHGSAWNAAFVYDGFGRLGATPTVRDPHIPAAPGPLRLWSSQVHLGARLGVELAGAWAALVLVGLTRGWRGLDRAGRAGMAALAVWLALGTVLFSVQPGMRPRYLEAFDPAVAGCLALGLCARPRWLPAIGIGAVLTASLATCVAVVAEHVEDSGAVGALPAGRVARLSDYLLAHPAHYELASLSASPAAAVIVHDARPVLVLTAAERPVVSVQRLASLVAAGQVRTVLAGGRCETAGCTALVHWVHTHGADVSAAAGEPRGRLWAVGAAPPHHHHHARAVRARRPLRAVNT